MFYSSADINKENVHQSKPSQPMVDDDEKEENWTHRSKHLKVLHKLHTATTIFEKH